MKISNSDVFDIDQFHYNVFKVKNLKYIDLSPFKTKLV